MIAIHSSVEQQDQQLFPDFPDFRCTVVRRVAKVLAVGADPLSTNTGGLNRTMQSQLNQQRRLAKKNRTLLRKADRRTKYIQLHANAILDIRSWKARVA